MLKFWPPQTWRLFMFFNNLSYFNILISTGQTSRAKSTYKTPIVQWKAACMHLVSSPINPRASTLTLATCWSLATSLAPAPTTQLPSFPSGTMLDHWPPRSISMCIRASSSPVCSLSRPGASCSTSAAWGPLKVYTMRCSGRCWGELWDSSIPIRLVSYFHHILCKFSIIWAVFCTVCKRHSRFIINSLFVFRSS